VHEEVAKHEVEVAVEISSFDFDCHLELETTSNPHWLKQPPEEQRILHHPSRFQIFPWEGGDWQRGQPFAESLGRHCVPLDELQIEGPDSHELNRPTSRISKQRWMQHDQCVNSHWVFEAMLQPNFEHFEEFAF
jgi:hypothetical protein